MAQCQVGYVDETERLIYITLRVKSEMVGGYRVWAAQGYYFRINSTASRSYNLSAGNKAASDEKLTDST